MTTYILARLAPGESTANVVDFLLKHGASFHSSTVVRELSGFIDDFENEEIQNTRLADDPGALSGDSQNSFLKLPQSIPRKPDEDSPLHEEKGEENASEVISDCRDEDHERKLTEESGILEKTFILPAKRAPSPSMENLNENGERALNAVDLLDEDILLAEETREHSCDSPNFLHNVLQPITRSPDEDSLVQKTAEAKKASRRDEYLNRKLTEQSGFFEKPFKLPVKIVPFPSMTKRSGNGPKALNAVDLLNENPDSLPSLVFPLPNLSTGYTIPGNVPFFIVDEEMPDVKQEEPSKLDNIGTQSFINPFMSNSDLAYNTHLDDKTNIKMEVDEECDVAPADSVENRRANESNESPTALPTPVSIVHQSFTCTICKASLATYLNLRGHMKRKHSQDKPFACELCDRKFASSGQCLQHRRSHQAAETREKRFECDECGNKFVHRGSLVVHKRLHSGETPHECGECKKRFIDTRGLMRHRRSHANKPDPESNNKKKIVTNHPCPENSCSASFPSWSKLKAHMTEHPGLKPFPCPLCEKSLSTRNSFNRHYRYHVADFTFKCEICEKRFPLERDMLRHVRDSHAERTHKCDRCEKKFRSSHRLKMHYRSHTGERPYECDVCHMRFSYSSVLTEHRRIHNREKPHKCDLCETSFTHYGSLYNHRTGVHKIGK